MKRSLLLNLAATLSLLLSIAVCFSWFRSRTTFDSLAWTWYRQIPNTGGGVAGDSLHLRSTPGRLWFSASRGRVGPPGNLVWGYHVNAHDSADRPRLTFHHGRHNSLYLSARNSGPDPEIANTSGWGPVRWHAWQTSSPSAGQSGIHLRIGISHWLLALLLLLPPILRLHRSRNSRRAARLNLCPACGYDLRATPARCPECGAASAS